MSRRRPRLTAIGAALLLVASTALSGCAGGAAGEQLTGSGAESGSGAGVGLAHASLLADPHSAVGPSTAVLAEDAAPVSVRAGEPSMPARVVSHDLDGDRTVQVASADRIIGLDISGSIGATIFALGLGEQVVGRDVSTTLPEAADLPVVTGDGHSVASEAVIALSPTVVVTDGTIGPTDVVTQLRDVGIAVVYVDPGEGLSAPGKLAEQVGAALGLPEAGQALATKLEEAISAKVAQIAAIAPQAHADRLRMIFLYIRGGSGVYYMFGKESGADALIEALGGRDVAGEEGWTGMRPMTDEALVAADPDLILVMTKGLESAGGVDGLLQAQPAIGLTTAGQNRRIVDMADGQILAFGPSTPQVLDALATAIYAR